VNVKVKFPSVVMRTRVQAKDHWNTDVPRMKDSRFLEDVLTKGTLTPLVLNQTSLSGPLH
jgi:hypothetical protein